MNEKSKKSKPKSTGHDVPAGTRALEEDLRKALGTQVQVFRSRQGGKIVVNFYSEEELHSIYEKIVSKK